MLINLQVGRTRPEERVKYLLYGMNDDREADKVFVYDGNPDLFEEIARHNPYKVKTYNYLISFAESKEELEEKLAKHGKTIEELYDEIISFLLPAEYYPRESLNLLAVGHADTDNFHIHLTVENYDHLNQKSLYIPKNRTELEYYRALERYIKVKYDLSFGEPSLRDRGRATVEKIKRILKREGRYKEARRDELKEELTNHLTRLIADGEIETREDLIAYLLTVDGVELNRIGKSYVSLKIEGEKKPLRLKGGIYDERKFNELREYIRTGQTEKPTLEEARELLEKVRRNRERFIAKRRRKHDLERLESPDTGRNREFSIQPEEQFNRESERGNKDSEVRPIVRFSFSLSGSAPNPVDSPSRELPSPKPESSSSSLRAEDTDRRERREVEELSSTGRDNVSGRQRELDTLQDDSDSYTAMKIRELRELKRHLEKIRQLEIEERTEDSEYGTVVLEDEVRKEPECLEEIRKRKQEEWKVYLQRQRDSDLGLDM